MNEERLTRYLDGEYDADPPAEFVTLRRQLASESVWLEPPADLQEAIVADITGQRGVAPQPHRTSRHRTARRWNAQPWAAAAAAVAAAVAVVAVIAFPRAETERLRMQGTELATSSSAIATIRSTPSGEDITLDITGLPPAPDGFFYQGWVRQGEKAVTIGTFHLRGGDDEVTLWSGVEVEDFPVLTVTLEPDDGDATSSGQVVLRGELGQQPAP